MQIFDLFNLPENILDDVGGKAKGLYKLHLAGLNVAKGFIITDIKNDDDIEGAAEHYQKSDLEIVAVRSSATSEDGADFSNAGQYLSFLNINNKKDFKQAVKDCIASLHNNNANVYSSQFLGDSEAKMTVVVQEFIDAKKAGVCFSNYSNNNKSQILIEAVNGWGENLVGGNTTADQYFINKEEIVTDSTYKNLIKETSVLEYNELEEITLQLIKAKEYFNYDIDNEWVIDKSGKLIWLQSRPITTNNTSDIDEFNCKLDISNHVITKCNISEMLPGAVTPLTISTSLHCIDWGIRKMFVKTGVAKDIDQYPSGSFAFSIKNHLFMDLSNLYQLEFSISQCSKEDIDMSICGTINDNMPHPDGVHASKMRKAFNFFKYISFLFSKSSALKKVEKIASNLNIEKQATAIEYYNEIEKNIKQMELAFYYHYVASSYSGGLSSAIIGIFDNDFDDKNELHAQLAGLYQNIDGIESADIIKSLNKISKTIIKDNSDAKSYNSKELLAYLESEDIGNEVSKAYNAFLERHGHRAIREAELRSMAWEDDKLALMDFLRTVLSSIDKKQKIVDAKSWVKTRDSLLEKYGPIKRYSYKNLIKLARGGVGAREFSKSQIIKTIDKFKKSYRYLASLMCDEKIFVDQDLIFFLTHKEIGDLVLNKNTALIKKAYARKRLLVEQEMLSFSDTRLGKPEPIEIKDINTSQNSFIGVPVSRGIAYGKARIVKSVEDANNLEKDEIMIASFTDIGWSPYYSKINGLVTEVGSALSHGAVVAREYSLPLIVNIPHITQIVKTGDEIMLNANTGELRIVIND